MTHGTEIPTLEDIEDSKKAMDDIQSITYSPTGDFVDAKGTTRKTINGIVDPVDAAATQGIADINAAADEFDVVAIDRLNDLDAAYAFTAINNGVWESGQTFTAVNQYMVFTGGTTYKPKNSTTLPYIVGATPVGDNNVEVVANLSTAQGDARYLREFDILADTIAAVDLFDGQSIRLKDRSAGNGGGAIWNVVLTSTVTPNAIDIVISTGNALLSLVLRVSNERPDVAEFGGIKGGITENATVFTRLEALTFSDVYVPEGTYKVTGVTLTKNYRGPGIIVLDGKAQINDKDFVFLDPGSSRNIIQFDNLNGVKVRAKHYPMGGFRFMGQYKKTQVPVFSIAGYVAEISVLNDLAFGMSSDVKENWYSVFACANQGDAVPTFRIVPFLRVDSVAGNIVTLRKAGEAIHSSIPQTYTWTGNALAGVDCLVITEGVDGRFVAFSGRQTTISSSTTTTVTIGTIGNISNQDWLLPAPNDEFEFYRYCGAFYMDTAEVRNIVDSGTIVKSRGISDESGTDIGAIATPEERQPSGYISPLASGVYLLSTGTLSTTSLGRIVEDFWTDSSHSVTNGDQAKEGTATLNYNMGEMYIPFSFGPQYYYNNGGSLASSRVNGQQNLWGWIEP